MSEPRTHPERELQLLAEGRLEAAARGAVEAHLAACLRCRRELEALRRVRSALKEDLPAHPVPPDLAARISVAIAQEAASGARSPRAARRFPRWAVAAGSVLAAAAAVALLLGRGRPDVLTAAAGDFADYSAGTLRLDLVTGDPAALERHFAAAPAAVPSRVFDFGMMGYRLAGGGLHRLAGRPSVLFAYEGADGQRVLCEMYPGAVTDLPAGAEEREFGGIRFLVYRSAGLTLVFWQEGTMVCVLITDTDADTAVQLAVAKAVKV